MRNTTFTLLLSVFLTATSASSATEFKRRNLRGGNGDTVDPPNQVNDKRGLLSGWVTWNIDPDEPPQLPDEPLLGGEEFFFDGIESEPQSDKEDSIESEPQPNLWDKGPEPTPEELQDLLNLFDDTEEESESEPLSRFDDSKLPTAAPTELPTASPSSQPSSNSSEGPSPSPTTTSTGFPTESSTATPTSDEEPEPQSDEEDDTESEPQSV